MFESLSEGFRHVITRETSAAKLTNALALLGNTPEQITDWIRVFTAYASVGGTIHDLVTISYEIAIGTHKPEQEEPLMTTQPVGKSDTYVTPHGHPIPQWEGDKPATLTFTAKNGVNVALEPNAYGQDHMRTLVVTGGKPGHTFPVAYHEDQVQALHEYFQHERDEQLGRWRDPEIPNLIVYPDGPDLVRVVDETTGVGWDVPRPLFLDDLDAPSWHGAAARYFAAHPEPREWHSAQPGDVWVLTIDGTEEPAIVITEPDGSSAFQTGAPTPIDLDHPDITAGRKLWPEESDDTCKHPETWFSRELCPPPCNSMHDICEDCARPADGCPFNPPGTYNAIAKESDDER